MGFTACVRLVELEAFGADGSSHFDDVLHPFAGGDGGDPVAVPTVVILEAIGSRRAGVHVSTVLVHLSVSYRTNGLPRNPLYDRDRKER
jgi:hypothetical protein